MEHFFLFYQKYNIRNINFIIINLAWNTLYIINNKSRLTILVYLLKKSQLIL